MKKSVFKIIFVATFTMAASYNVYALQQEVEMSDLALDNVEVLADDEGGGMLDSPNGCLDKSGHCFCYGHHPYEEKIWK